MSARLGYEALNQLAKDLGRPASTLTVLSYDLDPFSCGIDRHVAGAEWFADLWRQYMPEYGGHLRRLHYRLVSLSTEESPILRPTGERYVNTDSCWKALATAGLWARYLGLIEIGAMVDRRAPRPQLLLSEHQSYSSDDGFSVTTPETWAATIGEPEFPDPPRIVAHSLQVPQRYHLEVWVEKSDVEDVVLPLARRYGFNYVPLLGQSGLTPCHSLVLRAKHNGGRPVRIFYLSDFDPQGEAMPVAVARKVEWLLAKEVLDLDIQLIPIALTRQQCIDLQLPRTPIKKTDRGRNNFEERHGEGATELDALEALHPGELSRIITTEVARYYDYTLERRVAEANQEVRAIARKVEESVIADHEEDLASLKDDLDELTEQLESINQQIAEWRSRADPLYQQIADELEAKVAELDQIDPPEPAEADEHPEPLFDSRRTYLEQIARYKAHQGRPTERKVSAAKGKPMLKRRGLPSKRYTHTCQGPGCGKVFESASPVSKFCSNACNAKACRRRAAGSAP